MSSRAFGMTSGSTQNRGNKYAAVTLAQAREDERAADGVALNAGSHLRQGQRWLSTRSGERGEALLAQLELDVLAFDLLM